MATPFCGHQTGGSDLETSFTVSFALILLLSCARPWPNVVVDAMRLSSTFLSKLVWAFYTPEGWMGHGRVDEWIYITNMNTISLSYSNAFNPLRFAVGR